MTALLYFLVALTSVGLCSWACFLDRREPARQAFLALGWTIALAYLGFSLSLLPGLGAMRLLYMLAGCFVPAGALWTIDRVFAKDDKTISPEAVQLYVVTMMLAPVLVAIHVIFYFNTPSISPAELLAGLFATCTFFFPLKRLLEVMQATSLRVDKVRLTYLLAVSASAILFTGIEQVARIFGTPVDPTTLSIASRGVVLQGPVPPFSAFFVGVALYFLYSSVVLYRLLDVHELAARLATLLISALLLLFVDGITFMWVDTFTDYPLHSTFQIFLASVMFLAAYGPLRETIAWVSNWVFNQRAQRLANVLANLRAEMATVLSTNDLVETLINGLHTSGRIPVASVYLWSEGLDAFLCQGSIGHKQRPLKMVSASPFTEGFEEGMPYYSRHSVQRRSRNDPAWADILAFMDAMNADMTIPFVSGG
ncbi:MAG: hypothetical protein HN348_30055, partial [Proteobacteria bacterium]|nr:hypothetical protein [Pseudomonadota bacterium]